MNSKILSAATSILLVVLVNFIGWMTKKCISDNVECRISKMLLLEAVSITEKICTLEQIGAMYRHFGGPIFALFLYFALLWWMFSGVGEVTCTYDHLDKAGWRMRAIPEVFILTTVELTSGIFTLMVLKILWDLGINPHKEALNIRTCGEVIQINEIGAMLIELLGTFFIVLSKKCYIDMSTAKGVVLFGFVCTLITLLGIDYSGGYYNPILPSILLIGCMLEDPLVHLFVYWFGPILGAYLAFKLQEPICKSSEIYLQGLQSKSSGISISSTSKDSNVECMCDDDSVYEENI